ncbi:MAG: hypothetical protein HY746_07290 [Elusimicrobia bacterium]|nr:hypothetical protein [Elusimicrobiota bacterium]
MRLFFERTLRILDKSEDITFICAGVGVTFKTDEKLFAGWTKYYFAEYFEQSDKIVLNNKVYATGNGKIFQTAKKITSIFKCDANINTFKIDANLDFICCKNELPSKDEFTYYFLDKQKKCVLIIVSLNYIEAKYIPMRVIRALISLLLANKGWFYFHSACLVYKGFGIGIIGNKLAGKTTCIMNLMYKNGYNLLSNDKIALEKKDGVVNAQGFPIAIGVRIGTIRLFSILRQTTQNTEYFNPDTTIKKYRHLTHFQLKDIDKKIFFLPKEIVSVFNVSIVPTAPIRLLLIPQYDNTLHKPKLIKLSQQKTKAILQNQYLPNICPEQNFIEKFIGLDKRKLKVKYNTFIENAQHTIPCYKLIHNESTNKESACLVQNLIDKLFAA